MITSNDNTKSNGNTNDKNAAIITAVDKIIRERKTAKLMLEPSQAKPEPLSSQHKAELHAMIETAVWAPFHRSADLQHRQGELTSMVPWRFYVLERDACYRLNQHIEAQASSDTNPMWEKLWSKNLPKMIAAAGALVQVTWLPSALKEEEQGSAFHEDIALNLANIEHIAAAACAVQNLLLAAQARGWYNYWSTGGANQSMLRSPEVFDYLGIPQQEQLIGSIFLSPADFTYDVNKAGALRDKRGELADWARWVTL